MVVAAEDVRILSLTPGRMRLHFPGWGAADRERIEHRLLRVDGVETVSANPLTGNVLVRFDATADGHALRAELRQAWLALLGAARPVRPTLPRGPATPRQMRSGLLRAGVRGILGHLAGDALWFAAGVLGRSVGLPVPALGPLHLLMDVALWGAALARAGGAADVCDGGRARSLGFLLAQSVGTWRSPRTERSFRGAAAPAA